VRAPVSARRNASPVTTTAAIPTPTATACAVTQATNATNAITRQTTSVATTATATTRPPSAEGLRVQCPYRPAGQHG
jgi:hypothetical protein